MKNQPHFTMMGNKIRCHYYKTGQMKIHYHTGGVIDGKILKPYFRLRMIQYRRNKPLWFYKV